MSACESVHNWRHGDELTSTLQIIFRWRGVSLWPCGLQRRSRLLKQCLSCRDECLWLIHYPFKEKAAVHRKIESKNQIKTQWKMSWQQTGWIMWHVSRAKKNHTATNAADISWVGAPSVWSRTGCPSFCYENVTSTSSGRLQMLVWGIRSVL